MRSRPLHIALFCNVLSFGCFSVSAQTGEQEALEAQRERLQKEIENINHLLVRPKGKTGQRVGANGGIGPENQRPPTADRRDQPTIEPARPENQ